MDQSSAITALIGFILAKHYSSRSEGNRMKNKYLIVVSACLCTVLIVVGGIAFWSGDDRPEAPPNPTPQTQEKEVPNQADASVSNPSAFLYIAITILSFSTLISVMISFYLYKWRRILLANPNSVVPEEWAKYLQGVGEGVTRLSSDIDANLTRVSQESRLNTERIENMTKTYMELQEVLDEKDKEIARLKDGYDAEIFRRFIGRFARVDQALENLISDCGGSDELSLIKRLLEDAFEECGVEKTSPNIGDDYRTVGGVSDNPKIKHTNDPSLEFQIAEIIECGYELNTGIERKSIIPSKVKIYKYVEEAQ